jgi:hypothetical protein
MNRLIKLLSNRCESVMFSWCQNQSLEGVMRYPLQSRNRIDSLPFVRSDCDSVFDLARHLRKLIGILKIGYFEQSADITQFNFG